MGGGYGKYRTRKVVRALKSLAIKHSDKFILERAAKENYKIKPVFGNEFSYPVGANHQYIYTDIVKGVAERMERWGVCSKEEFLELVK